MNDENRMFATAADSARTGAQCHTARAAHRACAMPQPSADAGQSLMKNALSEPRRTQTATTTGSAFFVPRWMASSMNESVPAVCAGYSLG